MKIKELSGSYIYDTLINKSPFFSMKSGTVNVVLNRTVVVDSGWCFDNLCDSHLQSQSELYHVSLWY